MLEMLEEIGIHLLDGNLVPNSSPPHGITIITDQSFSRLRLPFPCSDIGLDLEALLR